MHKNSLLLFEKYARDVFKPGMSVLEIGPDTVPSSYEKIVAGWVSDCSWWTADVSNDRIAQPQTLRCDQYAVESPRRAFDVIVAGQVLEHVREPWTWMLELARLLKQSGTVVIIAPALYSYHRAPIDAWRVWPEGLRALFQYAGLVPRKLAAERLDPNYHNRDGSDAMDTVGIAHAPRIARGMHSRSLCRLLDRLAPDHNTPVRAAEIGVWLGETSAILLEHLPNLHLLMVDPWEAEGYNQPQERLDRCARLAEISTARWSRRRTIIREPSIDAASLLRDGSLDLVFIDGNHAYEQVLLDINAWLPKVRGGGILCGHDYGARRCPGVKPAVDEWIAEVGWELHRERGNVWWVPIP